MFYGLEHAPISRRTEGHKPPPGNASPSPGKKAITEEGDAFLANMRMWDVLLLTGDDPYSTRALEMHRPYSQAVPGQRAFCQGAAGA
jgi:hypothetical protein